MSQTAALPTSCRQLNRLNWPGTLQCLHASGFGWQCGFPIGKLRDRRTRQCFSYKDRSMAEAAKLKTPDGKELDLPIVEGTEHERALDISKLLSAGHLITLDEGYVNTGSCTSAITFLDGEKGILRYRGYPIEQLAVECDFLEVCYLLIYGE